MRKNSRQAYGVQNHFGPMGIVAGHQHSAHSWGTGRAVSRIPRVSGGGTHRAGQGAFGNMCRSGRMFAPTKTYRRWHRKINKTQKRQALASCLAATACAPLVEARGHRIADAAKEIPLVVSDDIESIQKTKSAVECLENLGLSEELTKCLRKQTRPGKGKMRGRMYKRRRGPLVVYKNDEGLVKAFRNIPGVDLMPVDSLNLLMLAPGGHVGRLCVWSKSAIESLEGLYSGKDLPKSLMMKDLNSIINSDEIQAVINAKKSIKNVPRTAIFCPAKRAASRLSEDSPWKKSLRESEKQRRWTARCERNSDNHKSRAFHTRAPFQLPSPPYCTAKRASFFIVYVFEFYFHFACTTKK